MQRNDIDIKKVAQVIEDINVEVQAQVDDDDKAPAIKKQWVMMVSDPQGVLEGKHLTGFVLQLPEEDSPYLAEERLFRAAYEHNQTKRGRRMPVRTIAELIEYGITKKIAEQNVWAKNKEPVLLVTTKNFIPALR